MTSTQRERLINATIAIGLIIVFGACLGWGFTSYGLKKSYDYTDSAIKKHYVESDSVINSKLDYIIKTISE